MEMAIATAIAALALVAILGMVPVALEVQNEGIDQTAVGTIFEDIHDRIEGLEITPGVPSISPVYYDEKGGHWDELSKTQLGHRYFRAEVELIEPANQEVGLVVSVKLFWPLDEEGNPFGEEPKPNSVLNYYTTPLTGPAWEEIDPNFIPKIEY